MTPGPAAPHCWATYLCNVCTYCTMGMQRGSALKSGANRSPEPCKTQKSGSCSGRRRRRGTVAGCPPAFQGLDLGCSMQHWPAGTSRPPNLPISSPAIWSTAHITRYPQHRPTSHVRIHFLFLNNHGPVLMISTTTTTTTPGCRQPRTPMATAIFPSV